MTAQNETNRPGRQPETVQTNTHNATNFKLKESAHMLPHDSDTMAARGLTALRDILAYARTERAIRAGYESVILDAEEWLDRLPTPPTRHAVLEVIGAALEHRRAVLDALTEEDCKRDRYYFRGQFDALGDLADLLREELTAEEVAR